jgi:hypothetical protein
MLPSVVMGFRIGENHIMGGFIICAFHNVVIKSQRGISWTCNLHGEIITLYNAEWCRSSSAVLSQVVIGRSKCLSCIGEAANMCMSSVVLDLSFCERCGTCSDHGGWEKQSWM